MITYNVLCIKQSITLIITNIILSLQIGKLNIQSWCLSKISSRLHTYTYSTHRPHYISIMDSSCTLRRFRFTSKSENKFLNFSVIWLDCKSRLFNMSPISSIALLAFCRYMLQQVQSGGNIPTEICHCIWYILVIFGRELWIIFT